MIAAADVAEAPTTSGVYFLLDRAHRLLYVGKASMLRRRLLDHSRSPRWRTVAFVAYERTDSEAAALAREAGLLAAVRTPWNKSHIDAFFSFVTPTPKGLALSRDGEYGCFPHLGRGAMSAPGRACIDGFDALQRIGKRADPHPQLVHCFLTGQSAALLEIALDTDQPHIRHGFERDQVVARTFYEAGPTAMRRLRLRHGGRGTVSAQQYTDWIREELTELLEAFVGTSA